MTPGFAKSRKVLFYLPYPEPDRVIINSHNFQPTTWSPTVNGKTPISAWVPSRDTAGNGTTTLNDLSTGGKNGTLVSMDPATDWVSDTSAGGVRALDFDGVNDRVTTGTSASVFLTNSTGAISVWVLPRGTSPTIANVWLGGFIGDGSGYLSLSRGIIGGNDRLWAYNYDGSEDRVGAAYTIDEWTHLVWLHTGGTLSLYKDSALVGSVASGNTQVLSGAISIGNAAPGVFGYNYFNGRIDDIRLFNQSLTADDIADLYAGGFGRGVQA